MSEQWGRWFCPYDGCESKPSDPDSIIVTCCGIEEHTVLLGPVENGHRWAERYKPTDADLAIASINAGLTHCEELRRRIK